MSAFSLTEEKRAALEKKTKVDLRASLISSASARGQTPHQVNNDFREMEFKNLPFRELGFHSLEEMLTEWKDICTVYGGLVYPVATEDTAHTLKLVQQQRKRLPTLRERKGRMGPRMGVFHQLGEGQSTALGSQYSQALFPPNQGPAAIPVAFRSMSSARSLGPKPAFDPAEFYGPNEPLPPPKTPALSQPSPPAQPNGNLQRVLLSGRVVGGSAPSTPHFTSAMGPRQDKAASAATAGPRRNSVPESPTTEANPLRAGLRWPPSVKASPDSGLGVGVSDEESQRPSSRAASVASSIAGAKFITGLQTKLHQELKAKASLEDKDVEVKDVEAKWVPVTVSPGEDDWAPSVKTKGPEWGERAGRQSIRVCLAQYVDLADLHFIRRDAMERLSGLERRLREVFEAAVCPGGKGAMAVWAPAPPAAIRPGLFCAVEMEGYGWNRGQVIRVDDAKDSAKPISVRCLDYGTVAHVRPQDLHLLPKCLAEEPELARKVRMFGWSTAEFSVPNEEALEQAFLDFCAEKEGERLVLDAVRVSEDGTAEVNLFKEGPGEGQAKELAQVLLAAKVVVPKSN